MSKKIDWKSRQDPEYKDKLRSVGKRLPKPVFEGLQNLERVLTSTPIRGNSPTGVGRPLTDDEYRQQISDVTRCVENFLSTNNSESSSLTSVEDASAVLHAGANTDDSEGLVDVYSESFWSVSDSITNMDEIKDLESAKAKIAHLADTLQKREEQMVQLEDHYKSEAEIAHKATIKMKADLDRFTHGGPPGPVNANDLVEELRSQCNQEFAVLRERTNFIDGMESRLLAKMDKEKCGAGLKYNKHKEAMRLLSRKPGIFERPTVLESAEDHIDCYNEYARNIHEDSDYYLDGYAQYLKGEALDYYESYRAVNKHRDMADFRIKFIARFNRVSVDELKKGASQRKQRHNESVREYGVEMIRLMAKMKLSENYRVEMLISNMSPSIQDAVMASYPDTVEQAISEGERQEAVFKSLKKQQELVSGGLKEQLHLKEAELNALHSTMKSKKVEFQSRSRKSTKDRHKSKRPSSSDSSRSTSNESGHSSGSNTSKSGRDSSASPSRDGKLNRHYSKDNYKKKSGHSKHGKSKSSKSHTGSDKNHKSTNSSTEGTLDTMPSAEHAKSQLNS